MGSSLTECSTSAYEQRHEIQRYHVVLLEAWRGKVPFSPFQRIVIDGFKLGRVNTVGALQRSRRSG